ncbi:MAG: hypothetical protein R2939_09430 [Kofleriaceae bacterium]
MLLRALAAGYVLHATAIAVIAWVGLDAVRVDIGGHIASADATWRGLYHAHDDAHFLGSIHGLFYPPLEDLVLGAFLRVVGTPSGIVPYVALLWAGFLAAGWRLGARFTSPARLAFLVRLLWFVTAERTGPALQGLSITELLITGLTSQLLAGIGLLLLLAELLAPAPRRRWWRG